jgi:predicted dehydrogenase
MNFAIIGCGLVGTKRARALGNHRLTWLVDKNFSRAKELAGETGTKRVSGDWKDLLKADDVHAVIVATSHEMLAPITTAMARAGKHVLVEKPAARSLSELTRVAREAKGKDVCVKVGFNHRFHPAVLKAKGMCESGQLGALLFVRGVYGHGGRAGYEKEWRAKRVISGGGELVDQGTHLIDLARWFLGDFTKADGITRTYYWDMEVEDNAFVALQTGAGQVAWLHASWTEWKNRFYFEIFGRNGKLQIDGLGGSYGTEKLAFFKLPPQPGPPKEESWEFRGEDPSWRNEIDEFVRAIQEKREPLGNLRDAKAVLDIVAKIYRPNKS